MTSSIVKIYSPLINCVSGVAVSISAFQALDLGSTPS